MTDKPKIKYILLIIPLLLVMLVLIQTDVNAKVVKVEDGSTEFSEGNKLTIKSEPDVEDFNITTTIPDSRLTWLEPEDSPNWGKVADESLTFRKYHNFQQHYDNQWLEIKDVQPTDEVTVWHGNAATYEGAPLDMRVTYKDLNYERSYPSQSNFRAGSVFLQISESPYSGFVYYNMSHGTVQYEFYYMDTGELVEIDDNSFMTFNSLNGYSETPRYDHLVGVGEFFNYQNYDTTQADSPVNAFTVEHTDIALEQHDHLNDGRPIFIGRTNTFTDKLGSDDFTNNSISFQILGSIHKFTFGSANRNSAWQAPSSAVVFNVTAPEPVKTVRDAKDKDITGGIVYGNQEITYRIEQRVNVLGEDILEKYNSFVIEDKLPNDVTFKSVSVYGPDGKTKLPKADIKTAAYDKASHMVSVELAEDFLKRDDDTAMQYTGESYFVEIDTQLKNVHEYSLEDDVDVVNTPTAIINKVIKHGTPVKNIIKSFEAALNIDRVKIYTGPADTGLHVNIELDTSLIAAKAWSQLADDSVRVSIKDTTIDAVVAKSSYKVSEIQHKKSADDVFAINAIIDPESLVKDDVRSYTVELTPISPGLASAQDTITLDGHTSTEGEIIGTPDDADGIVDYTGVSMVERTYGEDMIKREELIKIEWLPYQEVTSGYRYELFNQVTRDYGIADKDLPVRNAPNVKPETVNFDTMNIKTDGVPEAAVDSKLIDTSLDVYNGEASTNDVGLPDIKGDNALIQGDTVEYAAPQTYMTSKSGQSLSAAQIDDASELLIDGDVVHDAGHYMYIPAWIDGLSQYDVIYQSTVPFGANLMSYKVHGIVDVTAYMFSHIDSPTPGEDEILIRPAERDDIPAFWRDDE